MTSSFDNLDEEDHEDDDGMEEHEDTLTQEEYSNFLKNISKAYAVSSLIQVQT